jgi:hypothetical protein
MGTVIATHPAMARVPHEGWCDAHFLHLISGAYPLLLEDLHPDNVDPIIRSIGHYATMVDKAYLFELRVGRGALLASSLRFAATYDSHPEARYLLECLLRYASGHEFAPKRAIRREKFASMLMRVS